jgi:tight adherence protein C
MINVFVILALVFLVISFIAFLMLNVILYEEKLYKRLNRAIGVAVKATETPAAESLPVRVIAAVGFAVARSGILSANTLQQLRHTLRIAGVRGPRSLGLFVGTKLVLLTGLPILLFSTVSTFIPSEFFLIVLATTASVIGLLTPDFVINQRRRNFVNQIQNGLADTLDMMVICADAGLSLEAALARVAHEIGETHKAVSDELIITTQEMRIGADVRDALTGLGARTGLGSLKRLGSTLIQTIQYGTPLTQALRVLSAELRQEQLTRFEERAARLPVLLTVPMIIFILPCVFLVVGGPAILKVMNAFAVH